MVARTVLAWPLVLAAACNCEPQSHIPDGGDGACGDMHMRMFHRLRGGEPIESCAPLVSGVGVSRDPRTTCSVTRAGAASFHEAERLYVSVVAGGAWFERLGTVSELFTSLGSQGPPNCPDDDPRGCNYSGTCVGEVTQVGRVTGDIIELRLAEPCMHTTIDRGFPEGILVDALVIRGPLVTHTETDADVDCP